MATVSLTPQQQAQVDSANAALASAKSALDSAANDSQAKLAALNRCHCGSGKLAVKRGGIPAGTCFPLMNTVQFPNAANPTQCIAADFTKNCKTDCCDKDSCESKVSTYNDSLSVYNAANNGYNTAKNNLKAVLDAIAADPTTQANANIIIEGIQADKSKDMIKWLFFGLAAVLIVGGAIWVGMKVIRGGAAA